MRRPPKNGEWLTRGASWATIIGVPIGCIAVVLAFLTLDGSGSSGASSMSSPPRLAPIDLIARNGKAPHRPKLEVMVRNEGGGVAVVSRARIRIDHVYPLPLCFTQGDFPLSNEYGAQLPVDADPGDVVEVPLHQQVKAGMPDRFTIALGAVGEGGADEALPGNYLFELQVSLMHDADRSPLPLGRALVSVPGLPFAGVYFLEEGEFESLDDVYNPQGEPALEYWSDPLACWRDNGNSLINALAGDATRSPQLDEIGKSVSFPTAAELEP